MNNMTPVMAVTLSNHLSELERLHQVLRQFGNEQAIPLRVINTMNLAIEEIVANVIEHGFEDNSEHFICIRCSVHDGHVTAEVEDDGRPFNPLNFPDLDISKPLEDRQIGGLGIHLMRNVVDGLDYIHEGGKKSHQIEKKY